MDWENVTSEVDDYESWDIIKLIILRIVRGYDFFRTWKVVFLIGAV